MNVHLVMLGDGDHEARWVDSVWSTAAKAEERITAYLSTRTMQDTPDATVETWKVDAL